MRFRILKYPLEYHSKYVYDCLKKTNGAVAYFITSTAVFSAWQECDANCSDDDVDLIEQIIFDITQPLHLQKNLAERIYWRNLVLSGEMGRIKGICFLR
jgi:hypothetical protein